MSSKESDSDTDSDEEIQVKHFFLKFGDQIKQAKAQKNIKFGIKRQPGYYHLRDRRHAVLAPHRQMYEGKHWDVEVPRHLQRSTPRLTNHAIERAIQEERKNQIQNKHRFSEAQAALTCLNKEFDSVIVSNFGRMGMEIQKKRAKVEQTKDLVKTELVRKTSQLIIDQEVEQERNHRMSLLNVLGDESLRTPSKEDLLNGMAETNFKRKMINTDLTEAEDNLEKNAENIDNEYNVAMFEMKDESLAKVVHTFAANETKECFDKEKNRRISEQQPITTRERKIMQNALSQLTSAFKEVESENAEEESKYKLKVEEIKDTVQEQLLRTVAKKWADKAVAEERARRIHDAEESGVNPAQNAMRHLVSRVQRQMLLQKFKGKWINLAKNPKNEGESTPVNETEYDRRLRLQREHQRRALGVAKGDDD